MRRRASTMCCSRRLLFAAVLLTLPGTVSADAGPSQASPWEKFGEEDGIALFRREVTGSPIIALRGVGVVDAPLLRVASVLVDTSRSTEWVDRLAEVKVVRRLSDDQYVHWNHVNTPIVLRDRDFVYAIGLELDPTNKRLMLNYHSVYDSGAPKTNYIRGEFKYGTFTLTSIDSGKKARVLAEVLADPKGSVAKWLVNLFQKSWPHATIANLRRQVAKKDIVDQPRLKELLAQKGY